MTRRLLYLLLAICLALPAMAMPLHGVDSPAPAIGPHQAMHHPAPRQSQPGDAQRHDCIGCIAPYHVANLAPGDALPPAMARGTGPASTLVPITATPETPPPRAA